MIEVKQFLREQWQHSSPIEKFTAMFFGFCVVALFAGVIIQAFV